MFTPFVSLRSLGVSTPFATAKENLLLLLEKSRSRSAACYVSVHITTRMASALDVVSDHPLSGLGCVPYSPLFPFPHPLRYPQLLPQIRARLREASASSPPTPPSQRIADLSCTFVRLHGMLFDRINLEQYNEVATVASACLAKTLGENNVSRGGPTMKSELVLFSQPSFELNPSGESNCRELLLQRSQPFDHFPLHLAAVSAHTAYCRCG